MKAVILAGGFGTRLSEQTDVRPKPMVEVGGKPILWHIMNVYAHYGFKEFIIALGYKGEVIKDYFRNYHTLNSDLTIDLAKGEVDFYGTHTQDWKVTLVDTGANSLTGGRVKRLAPYIGNEPFMVTYGDGVANIDIGKLVKFHQSHGKMATVTAVHPKAHYGELEMEGDKVTNFMEKPQLKQSWINGGFFVFQPEFLELIEGDQTILEREPLEAVAQQGELYSYKHDEFWQCMDTLRDVRYLDDLWQSNQAPWKIWE